jgi:hypothetical protein
MPAYEIYFRCPDCKREHAIHVRIHLNDGPDHKETLAKVLARRSLPPQLARLRGRKAFCLKTGRMFKLESDEDILLVPLRGYS